MDIAGIGFKVKACEGQTTLPSSRKINMSVHSYSWTFIVVSGILNVLIKNLKSNKKKGENNYTIEFSTRFTHSYYY